MRHSQHYDEWGADYRKQSYEKLENLVTLKMAEGQKFPTVSHLQAHMLHEGFHVNAINAFLESQRGHQFISQRVDNIFATDILPPDARPPRQWEGGGSSLTPESVQTSGLTQQSADFEGALSDILPQEEEGGNFVAEGTRKNIPSNIAAYDRLIKEFTLNGLDSESARGILIGQGFNSTHVNSFLENVYVQSIIFRMLKHLSSKQDRGIAKLYL